MSPKAPSDAKILIIDDDPTLIELLRYILYADGYRNVLSTSDPRQALPMYREHRPDLLLLDLNMTPIDGFELLEELRPFLDDGDFVPIVVINGEEPEAVKNRALAAGATEFISKPFDPTEIILRARNLIQMRFLHRQLRRQNQLLKEKGERVPDLSDSEGLIASRSHFQALLDDMPDAVFMADDTARVVGANPAACALTGSTQEELMQMSIFDLAPPNPEKPA